MTGRASFHHQTYSKALVMKSTCLSLFNDFALGSQRHSRAAAERKMRIDARKHWSQLSVGESDRSTNHHVAIPLLCHLCIWVRASSRS